jgi:hypothetical protein
MKVLLVTSPLIAIALAILVPAAVNGQVEYPYPPYGGLAGGAYYGDYGGYGGYGYFSSTAAEGYARGTADVIRSHGIYNQLSADAAVRLEEARKKHIENYQQAVGTYFQVRDQNKARRDAGREKKRVQLAKWLQQRDTKVPRLGVSQLNPETGEIVWPTVLMDEAFSEHRKTLEGLFVKRAKQGGLYAIADRNISQRATAGMLEELRTLGQQLIASDRILARRFVEALAHELSSTP